MARTKSYSTNTCPVHSAALMRKKLSGRRSSGTSRILFSCSSSAFPGCTQMNTNLYCQHPQRTCMNTPNLPLLVSQAKLEGFCLLTQIFTAGTHGRHAWMLQPATASKSSQAQRIPLTDKHKSLLPAPTVDMHERSNLPLLVSQDKLKGFCLQTQIFTASTHQGHAWTLQRATANKSKDSAYRQTQIFTAGTHSGHAWRLQRATASKSSQTQSILLTDKHKSFLPAPTVDMHERSNLPLLVSQVKLEGFCLQTQIFIASTDSGHAWTLALQPHTVSKSSQTQRILLTDKHKSLLLWLTTMHSNNCNY